MDKHKHNVEQKSSQTKKRAYVWFHLYKAQYQAKLIPGVWSQESGDWKGHEEDFRNTSNVLFLELGTSYLATCVNSLSWMVKMWTLFLSMLFFHKKFVLKRIHRTLYHKKGILLYVNFKNKKILMLSYYKSVKIHYHMG